MKLYSQQIVLLRQHYYTDLEILLLIQLLKQNSDVKYPTAEWGKAMNIRKKYAEGQLAQGKTIQQITDKINEWYSKKKEHSCA